MRLADIGRSFMLTTLDQDYNKPPIRVAGIESDGPLALGHGRFCLSLKTQAQSELVASLR
jgi:hypothetical protein